MNIVKGNKILVLDIETCGWLKAGGSIVEIGIVELDLDTGTIIDVFDSMLREEILCQKHREKPYDWIFQNSDMTVEEVRKAPEAYKGFSAVQEILDAYPLGCTAYNKRFDFDYLKDRGLKFRELPCPMQLSRAQCRIPGKYGKVKTPNVEESFKHFFPEIEYTEKHRGLDDAHHEAMIVFALYQAGAFRI